MKKILFASALLFIISQSCQSPGQKKALDYNNKIAEISKINQSKWIEIVSEIMKLEQTKNFSKLGTLSDDLINYLDKEINELNNTQGPTGSGELKTAAIDFFRFERKTADEKIRPFSQMNDQTTSEEIQAKYQELQQAAADEESYLTKLRETQRKFGKENGFKIEEPKK